MTRKISLTPESEYELRWIIDQLFDAALKDYCEIFDSSIYSLSVNNISPACLKSLYCSIHETSVSGIYLDKLIDFDKKFGL